MREKGKRERKKGKRREGGRTKVPIFLSAHVGCPTLTLTKINYLLLDYLTT